LCSNLKEIHITGKPNRNYGIPVYEAAFESKKKLMNFGGSLGNVPQKMKNLL
jgi:hypothetical protein